MSHSRIRILGGTASPYTRKMVALMRYRQIPYSITWAQPQLVLAEMGVEPPKPLLYPTFLFDKDDGEVEAVCDSTPIIRRLEALSSERSVLPVDQALAFIDYLIEDFADEWCSRYMFHYRWYPQEDADNAGTLIPLGFDTTLPNDQHQAFKAFFSRRQIDRLCVVGSSDTTAPMIDASYRRFLQIMENHLATQDFMLGSRPAAGDFALYGQLSQLVGFDPSSRAIAHEVSPRTVAWVDRMEDLSGLEPEDSQWNNTDELPETLRALLLEIGRMYAPTQLANAKSVQAGEKTWEVEIDNTAWTQQTFSYQAKCLKWTHERYQALNAEDRARVDRILSGSGCEVMLAV